jgi:hypothetical protein
LTKTEGNQIQWFGDVQGMDKIRIPREILELKPE